MLTSAYWSSTTRASNPDRGWIVSLSDGFTGVDVKAFGANPVWPVRGE